MCRAPSKLGVFNLLKPLETKGGVNVMQYSVPNDDQFALVGLLCTAVQSQKAVSTSAISKQILPFGFVEQCTL